ncbi:MAG: cysteine--tRNA ligase [archaeon]|nr:MAG: cysteine--tRNA ligase [archaeon]
MLKLYNTLTRKKEEFKPIRKGFAGIYSCGPTVYWFQHIGNLRAYVAWDILKRVLKYDGYKVKHVMNVTDVGHLTSDQDEGEDKVEKAAKKEGKSASEITHYYFDVFSRDFSKLNLLNPEIWAWATKHISEQIDLIKKLEKKGLTYRTSDGIYFDTSKFKQYGKLGKIKKETLQAGKRITLKEKKNKTDFALWKFSHKPGLRQQEWRSPWGIGFPGWHLECSAMSMKYLGEHFDIHTGGEEHIPIHHQNEIAQSEAATGKKFVNYWLHLRWLLFSGEKMSKSKGIMYTITALEKKGYNPLSYRYFCLTGHYRTQLNFTFKNLDNAQKTYFRLKNIISELKDDKKLNERYLKEFQKAINNDLDTPKALQVLWKLVRDKKAPGKVRTIKKIDEVFGLDLFKQERFAIPKKVLDLIKEREKARKEKNFKKADKLREQLKKFGYSLDDTGKGTKIRRIK